MFEEEVVETQSEYCVVLFARKIVYDLLSREGIKNKRTKGKRESFNLTKVKGIRWQAKTYLSSPPFNVWKR